jgi:hypothetical protein
MSDDKSSSGQSGGVSISGGSVTVSGSIVGRDMTIGSQVSPVQN